MSDTNPIAGTGIESYFRAVTEVHQRVIESQRELLATVAARMADTIIGGGRIYVFGTGHSHMLAEEGYARAGGLMSVVPIFYSALMLHESIQLEAKIERIPGLAGDLLDRSGIKSGEMLFVYSNSGVNHLPVEMALEAKKRGGVTVTVNSMSFAKVAPLSSIGKRLADICDFTIDNGGVAGDGICPVPGLEWKVGPTSTVIGALIWNALVVEATHHIQLAKGDAPVGVSFNMPGYAEHAKKDGERSNLQPRPDAPLMKQQFAIGVDLGATKIATALMSRDGAVLDSRHTPTLASEGPDAVCKRIADQIRALLLNSSGDVIGAGIGSAGLVDAQSGIVKWALNLNWKDVPLSLALSRNLNKLDVFVDNDANADALGEGYFGSAQGLKNYILLTIGSGLGSGLVHDGKLVNGTESLVSNLGHYALDPDHGLPADAEIAAAPRRSSAGGRWSRSCVRCGRGRSTLRRVRSFPWRAVAMKSRRRRSRRCQGRSGRSLRSPRRCWGRRP